VLNSSHLHVVKNSIQEIEYQTELASLINADVINIHGGGGYGDKKNALKRFKENFEYLSDSAKSKLTVENDDRIYTPSDLLSVCHDLKIPFVYDVHHHRCHGDDFSIEKITELAIKTWNREPLFHISSPRDGWLGNKIRPHHDYIDISDFPDLWRNKKITIEVEAKFKELAVMRLMEELKTRQDSISFNHKS
jgi:UV DNA damage endonuclease